MRLIFKPAAISIPGSAAMAAGMGMTSTAPADVSSDEVQFSIENDSAMKTMMQGMEHRSSGDIDRDFAIMMIAHHQGAVDMALAEMRHGRNERLRRLAQGIVVEQRQEIAAMQTVIDQELRAPADQPSRPLPQAEGMSMPGRVVPSHRQ